MSTATAAPTMQVLSPEGAYVPPIPVPLAPGAGELHGAHFALLSNTKPNVDLLLRTYADLLQERFETSATSERKLNAAVGGGPLIGELSAVAQVAITGVADCGGCSAQSARDAVALEREGVPTVLVTTSAFVPLVLNQARYSGADRVRLLVFPHPFESLSEDAVVKQAKDSLDEVVGLLCGESGTATA
jgi:hypothetical protein